jgi:hypothetical protein
VRNALSVATSRVFSNWKNVPWHLAHENAVESALQRSGSLTLEIQTVRANDLWGFIILHGALNPRPWGRIEIADTEALNNYQSTTIDKFRHELARH